MKILYCVVEGRRTAARLSALLVDCSKWFSVEPWPDDKYYITVKDEPGLPTDFDWRSGGYQ